MKEENSLAIKRPDIAKEWHPTKNDNLKPIDVTISSNKIVWWQCPKSILHDYPSKIANRTNGINCPYCAGQKVCKDNNLAVVRPDVAKEWHPTKNDNLKPKDFTFGSGKKVWWQCPNNILHNYSATINNRTNGKNCPYCAGQKVCEDNNLAVVRPDIAKEWHRTKNGDLKATDVTCGSNKKVWWQCSKKPLHEWLAKIDNRTRINSKGCPYCTGRKVCEDNNLAVNQPEIAKEWHPKLNGELNPTDVTVYSNKEVWWQCALNPEHQWIMKVGIRTRGSGCPKCSSRIARTDKNLEVERPEIAKEWHPTKNIKLKPTDVTYGSKKKVWWQCAINPEHQWFATINSRTRSNGTSCPYCAVRKKLKKRPELRLYLKS